MFEKVPVQSSNLEAVSYDEPNRRIIVWFKSGGTYAYNNVPKETYEQLLAAESKGEFLNAELKPKFPATVVLMPEYNPMMAGFTQQVLNYLDWNFAYHQPSETQMRVYTAIRLKAKELAAVIMANCPADDARQRALDFVKLAVMTANQAVALNPAHYDPELRKKLEARQAAQARTPAEVIPVVEASQEDEEPSTKVEKRRKKKN